MLPPLTFVFSNAIYSEQVRDERAMPSKVENWWQVQRQSSGNPNMKFYNAHSAFKNKKEGRANSFEAHTYYNDQAKAKREAMLAEIANEC